MSKPQAKLLGPLGLSNSSPGGWDILHLNGGFHCNPTTACTVHGDMWPLTCPLQAETTPNSCFTSRPSPAPVMQQSTLEARLLLAKTGWRSHPFVQWDKLVISWEFKSNLSIATVKSFSKGSSQSHNSQYGMWILLKYRKIISNNINFHRCFLAKLI